jgi:hypothetical protein
MGGPKLDFTPTGDHEIAPAAMISVGDGLLYDMHLPFFI